MPVKPNTIQSRPIRAKGMPMTAPTPVKDMITPVSNSINPHMGKHMVASPFTVGVPANAGSFSLAFVMSLNKPAKWGRTEPKGEMQNG
jgi:hypothetical protein